ncbi:MAG TPA: condensation domain-containing protein, partial [Micromonosporaceae bacterium]|nr:condensation domain-containing protein [Micromonosporaceae bacterium]
MSDIMKRLAKLPQDKRNEFLALLLDDDDDDAAAGAGGPTRRDRTDRTPLSFAQETLWFLDRLAPGLPAYNVPLCFRLSGPLDVPALHRALASLVARHEALRTQLTEESDGPVQVVAAEVPVELPVHDVPAADVPAEAVRRAGLPFDLATAPLWRACLLRSGEQEHHFLFTVHHAVFDGWSLGVFVDDLAARYAAERDGAPDQPLPELPVQYADYALWQREWLSGERLDRLNAYWRDRLAGAATLEFPTDRPRPREVTYTGRVRHRLLTVPAQQKLRALVRSLGATPYTAYVAAFAALLRRYTSQDDIVIGSPTANREHAEVERLIGFFVNMLVLRLDAGGDPTLRELLERCAPTVRDAFAHGALPFDKLVEAVRPVRDPARSPIFQVAFTFQNAGGDLTLPGLTAERVLVDPGTSRFDMSWNLSEVDDGLDLNVEYNTDLFDAETIDALMAHYGVLVNALATAPETPLSAVPLLDEDERTALLTRWNGAAREVPATTIPELFARQVTAAPERIALVVGAETLTYADLDRRANQLANLLVSQGARPGELVALCLPRGADLVVSVLATLKAGAGYLPLDPGHPGARIAGILDDAGPVAVLATAATADALPAGLSSLVRLDDVAEKLAAQSQATPDTGVTPEDLAYVLYTSGSTGTPKGVLIEHRNVVNFITSVQELFDLTPADRILGFAAHTFDVSVFETFAALLTGARLHLAEADERLDIERLQTLLERGEITVTDLPPSVMALLEPERLPALRIVFVGGEAFGGELVNRWNPNRRFFNGYGPTECT